MRASTTAFLPVSFATVLVSLLTGCALQSYAPRPLDAHATAQQFQARSLESEELRQYLLAQGQSTAPWPRPSWNPDALTLAAFYFHPDLEVARARARAARAQVAVAAQRPALGITPRIEHHSREDDGDSSPWSLGFEIDIPLGGTTRRDALQSQADYRAQAAELEVGAVAWSVRQRLRTALLHAHAMQREIALLETESAHRQRLIKLLEQRLEAGMIAAPELSKARVEWLDLQGRLAAVRAQREQLRSAIAAAIGVTPSALRSVELTLAEFDRVPEVIPSLQVQRDGLHNRVDVRRSLVEFAAADAGVKLEIARQYPEISLSPGFLWDQGDNVWSLAAQLLLPATIGNKPQIAAAQANREQAAQEFLRVQASAIGSIETAAAHLIAVQEQAREAQQLAQAQTQRGEQVRKRFDAGDIDRVELLHSELESVAGQRNSMAMQVEVQRALGALEDALQQPLIGGPFPVTRSVPPAGDLAQR